MNRRLIGAASIIVAAFFALANPQSAAADPVSMGDDTFVNGAWKVLHGRCVGVVVDRSSLTTDGSFVVDKIRHDTKTCIKALFVPGKDVRGESRLGTPSMFVDRKTGLPVYALRNGTVPLSAHMLKGIDVVLFDLQDIGDRQYPTVDMLADVMSGVAATGKELWILDRPDPIGGVVFEGPMLESKAVVDRRFRLPLPARYAMTVGEIARMANDLNALGVRLQVFPMPGWKRGMVWGETGLAWVPPTPNLPFWQTALVYPATATLTSAGLNIAFGTAAPYQYIGTPRTDGQLFADRLNKEALPGVQFIPVTWQPKVRGPMKKVTDKGAAIGITDLHGFKSIDTAVALLVTAHALHLITSFPNAAAFDRSWGSARVRTAILRGKQADEIRAAWVSENAAYDKIRTPYLLYP